MDAIPFLDWTLMNMAPLLCALTVVAGADAVRVALRSRSRTMSLPSRPLVTFVMLTNHVVLILGLAAVSVGIRGLSMIYFARP